MKISHKIENIFLTFDILIFARGGYESSGNPLPKFKGISGKKKQIGAKKKSFFYRFFGGISRHIGWSGGSIQLCGAFLEKVKMGISRYGGVEIPFWEG